MRIKVHCQNRVGILRDILNLLVDYGINVNRGEVGGDQGTASSLGRNDCNWRLIMFGQSR